MLIVIIGPDGCGKTTIARRLIQDRQELGFKDATEKSCNFGILPQIKSMKRWIYSIVGKQYHNKKAHKEGEFHGGMKHPPNSLLQSLVLFSWYLLDYVLGYLAVRKCKKKSEVLIFTRYYYDYYYQRTHQNLPKRLVRIAEYVIPKPDLIIFPSRSAESIFKFKPELSLEEIERQNSIILHEFENRASKIDGSQGIEISVEEAKKAICEKMSQ